MHDLSLIAASEWARTNTNHGIDPVVFGHKVALVYLACRSTGNKVDVTTVCEDIKRYADEVLKAAGYKSGPDDPIPMPVDSVAPDRPLPPTSASVKEQIESLYAAMQASYVHVDATGRVDSTDWRL